MRNSANMHMLGGLLGGISLAVLPTSLFMTTIASKLPLSNTFF